MSSTVHTAVTTGADIASALAKHTNGVAKEVTGVKGAPATPNAPVPQRKPRSKYKHIAALHSKSRPSCLSHETEALPSFLGFRNLMVIALVVMNLRLVLENFKKYGILISVQSKLATSDVRYGILLYALTPCHLFVAYIIERVAMENAKAAVGRRKKSDTGVATPESEIEKKQFYNTWWWIAAAHTVNATFTLAVSSAVIYWLIQNPGIGEHIGI